MQLFNSKYFLQFTKLLEDFGVDVGTDIVAVTGDGASVMRKFGRLLKLPYLICSNHTINLAVTDEIFTKVTEAAPVVVVQENDDDGDESSGEAESDTGESDSGEESDCESLVDSDAEADQPYFEAPHDYQSTIQKMRKIIKAFRYSTEKTAMLEKTMTKDGLKPQKFIADVKTRWNSLVISGTSFLIVWPSALKVLLALKNKKKLAKKEMGLLDWDVIDTEVLQVCIHCAFA